MAGPAPQERVREDLLAAAVHLLASEGAAALRVRRIADTAGVSTMAVYSRFGSLEQLLDAVYAHGFAYLEAEMSRVTPGHEPLVEIERLGLAYRRFALDNPGLFALMFEHPLLDFDPSLEARSKALSSTFGILQDAVGRSVDRGLLRDDDPTLLSYLIWVTTHGAVSLELTHAIRSPLPGWFIDSEAAGTETFLMALRTTIAGLRSGV